MGERATIGEKAAGKLASESGGMRAARQKCDAGSGNRTPSRRITAVAWVNARRARDRAFGPDLFSDPAWDMLLDLYINSHRPQPTCVSDLFHASSSPPTTIIRWLTTLENRGLVRRQPDLRDRRRLNVSLTDLGKAQMEDALDLAVESDRHLGLGRLGVVE